MGKDCCSAKEGALIQLRERQAKVLKLVFAINAIMFLVEFGAGIAARSTALLADSLDMFGDATVYAFSLYVLHKSSIWRARAALFKGLLMLAFGIGVLLDALYKLRLDALPVAETIGTMGFIALLANLSCLFLLFKHRQDDINMRSTWICSRNDIVANLGVLLAAGLVAMTQSKWPDMIIGLLIASLFLKSAYHVIQESREQLGLKLPQHV